MKRILLYALALFALGADPAHAGPLAAVAGWISTTLAAGGIGAALLRIGIGIAFNALSTAIARATAEDTSQKGWTNFEKEVGDATPLAFVVGDYVTAAKLKYYGKWGPDDRYITEVLEYSCLPQGLDGLIINDEEAEILWGETSTYDERVVTGYTQWSGEEADGWNPIYETKSVTIGHPITNLSPRDGVYRIWIKVYDGTQIAADPLLLDVFGDREDYPYTEDHIGTGKSYVVITTQYDRNSLTSYPSYMMKPAPLAMYDPRKDSTAGGAGAHRWGDRSTYEPSRNNAVIAYNIARGIYLGTEWIFGGKSLPAWCLPLAEWTAAMNDCDAAVALSEGGTEPAFRCGYRVTVDMLPRDVLEEIGRAANMRYALAGGRMKPVMGASALPVMTITDADIIITEGQSFQPFLPASDTYNALSATYPEPGEAWAVKDAPEYLDVAATEDDGGRYLPVSITYAAAPFGNQVQRLMQAQMRDYRRMRIHQFSLPPDAYSLEAGDVLTWPSERNGYTDKRFQIEAVSKLPGLNVAVSLREVDPGDADWSLADERPFTITPPPPARIIGIAVPGFLASAGAVQNGDDAPKKPAVVVGCHGTAEHIDRVHVQIRRLGETSAEFDSIYAYEEPFRWVNTDVAGGTSYQVRMQLKSSTRRASVWSNWETVTTPDIRIVEDDLSEDLAGKINAAFDRHDAALEDAEGVVGELRDAALASYGPLDPEAETSLAERLDFEIPRLRDAEDAARELYERLTVLAAAQFATDQRMADAGIYVEPSSGLVKISAVVATQERVGNVEITLDAVLGEISQKASVAYVNQAVSEAVLDPSQIPLLDDITARLTSAETTLSAETGRIDSLTATLTVEGDLITMSEVVTTLDSLANAINLRVTYAEFEEVESRIGAAELAITSLGDTSAIAQTVEMSRSTTLTLAELWSALTEQAGNMFSGFDQLRGAMAQGVRELRATVDELGAAEASERLALAAALDQTNALIVEERTARVSGEEALAQSLTLLGARLDGEGDIAAAISDLQSTRVTSAGAVAAVEQTISATYGDMEAMADAVAFAEATADGIAAGYVLQLNGDDVLEAVSVDDGVGGDPVSTFKLSADLVQITGLTQINTVVIESLAASSAFLESLEVDEELIVQGAVYRTFLDTGTTGQLVKGDSVQVAVEVADIAFQPKVTVSSVVKNPIRISIQITGYCNSTAGPPPSTISADMILRLYDAADTLLATYDQTVLGEAVARLRTRGVNSPATPALVKVILDESFAHDFEDIDRAELTVSVNSPIVTNEYAVFEAVLDLEQINR